MGARGSASGRPRLREQHRDARAQARKLEAMGRLTGGIAHDLNNLLTIIIGNLELLTEQTVPPALREMTREALDAALSGADLTRRLLAFARREVMLSPQSDLNAVVAGMASMLARALGANITLELALAPDLWAVHLDKAELETAIINVVSNARDALPAGGQVRIVTRNRKNDAQGRRVILEVTDTGTGMTADVRARAFEPYFTTKAAQAGSGLGLATVKDFARAAGGDVEISSEPETGTTVSLSFPPGAPPQDEEAQPSDQLTLIPGATVLIVDDDAALRRSVRRQLVAAGFRCLDAENGDQAMHLLARAGSVDLLFADVVMPGELDGPALSRAAMRAYPGIRAVLTSAQPGRSALQGIPILAKPYRSRDLIRTLQATLARPPPMPD